MNDKNILLSVNLCNFSITEDLKDFCTTLCNKYKLSCLEVINSIPLTLARLCVNEINGTFQEKDLKLISTSYSTALKVFYQLKKEIKSQGDNK